MPDAYMPVTTAPPAIEPLLELVRESLRRQWHEQLRENLRDIEVINVLERPYSLTAVLAVSTDRAKRQLVLKHAIDNPLNSHVFAAEPNQALAEYNILAQLNPGFEAIRRCAVPRPVAVFPEIAAFLMEYVEGHVLADDLRFVHYLSRRARFHELQTHFFDCGRWLRHFQEFTSPRQAGPTALKNVTIHCVDRLRIIEKSRDRRVPQHFRDIAMRFLQTQIDALGSAGFLVAGCHSDFGPWNTLVGPQGVTVIDFFGFQEGPLPVDVLSMLVFLDSIGHGLANSRFRIKALRERFLAGLGPISEIPQPLVLLCEAQQRILHIAGAVIAKAGGGPFRCWERTATIRAHVDWFRSDPQQSQLWPN